MGRVLLAGAVIVACVSTAHAGRKVLVETEPPGATVYLNGVDEGVACQPTPCTIDAPIGQTPVIVQLAGYSPEFGQVDVKRNGRVPTLKFSMTKAVATLVIEAPGVKGASIRVDDEDKGKAPARVEVASDDGHHVVLVLGGKTIYDEIITVEANQELEINPKGGAGNQQVAVKDADPVVTDDLPDDTTNANETGGEVEATAPKKRTMQALVVGAAFDVGFRQFEYQKNAMSGGNIRNASNIGQAMGGLSVEVWPMVLFGALKLRGFALSVRYVYGLNSQAVGNTMNLKTAWSALDAGARYRWPLGSKAAIEARVGYALDAFSYTGDAGDRNEAPDASYGALRIGARLLYRGNGFEPYLNVENRIVLTGGEIASRYDVAKAQGYRAAVGIGMMFGKVVARFEASALRYSWEFDQMSTSEYEADGASDTVEMITVGIGYAY